MYIKVLQAHFEPLAKRHVYCSAEHILRNVIIGYGGGEWVKVYGGGKPVDSVSFLGGLRDNTIMCH